MTTTRGSARVFVAEFRRVSLQCLGGLVRGHCDRKSIHAEPAGHRRVFDRLHLHRVRCQATLELGDHQPTVNTEPQNIEPVVLCAALHDPPVVLDGNNHHARSQDLGIGDDPLLQMLTLQQSSGLQCPGGHRSRRSSRLHRQQQLTCVQTPPRRAAELPGLSGIVHQTMTLGDPLRHSAISWAAASSPGP
jgi:hypothetical protein